MPIIKITQSMIDASKPLTPGWYKAQALKLDVKQPAQGKTGINYLVTYKIESDNPSIDGREIMHNFNSGYAPNIIEMHKAATGVTFDGDTEVEINDWIGKKLQIFVNNGSYQGKINNKVDDWAPYEKDLTSPEWVG